MSHHCKKTFSHSTTIPAHVNSVMVGSLVVGWSTTRSISSPPSPPTAPYSSSYSNCPLTIPTSPQYPYSSFHQQNQVQNQPGRRGHYLVHLYALRIVLRVIATTANTTFYPTTTNESEVGFFFKFWFFNYQCVLRTSLQLCIHQTTPPSTSTRPNLSRQTPHPSTTAMNTRDGESSRRREHEGGERWQGLETQTRFEPLVRFYFYFILLY